MILNLELAVHDSVCRQLEALDGQLDEIVRCQFEEEVDRRVQRLLAQNLETRANGATTSEHPAERAERGHRKPVEAQRDIGQGDRSSPNPSTRECTVCHEHKPLGAFEKHRNQCRACRRQAERDRESSRRREDSEVPVVPFDGPNSIGLPPDIPETSSGT